MGQLEKGQIRTNEIREIYGLLGDDLSREVYENRLLYSLTGDMKFVRNVVCTIPEGKEIYKRLKTGKNIGIFGAGDVGRHLVHVYTDIPFECFIDNKRAGTMYEGLPVLSLKEYRARFSDGTIVISTKLYYREIIKQLLDEGIPEENIINIGMEYEKLNHLQYFDLPQLEEKKAFKEIFVDCGSYDGSTAIDFLKWCSGQGGYVYAWEPDPDNQKKCRMLLDKNQVEYELIPKGLWSEERELMLKTAGTGSVIADEGDVKIQVDSIDRLTDKPVTFIKMDIEGAEYQALLGARKTIETYKPKLAICVYHMAEDIWQLPWLIHEINPEYKFFLRHYSFADNETVLYAL